VADKAAPFTTSEHVISATATSAAILHATKAATIAATTAATTAATLAATSSATSARLCAGEGRSVYYSVTRHFCRL